VQLLESTNRSRPLTALLGAIALALATPALGHAETAPAPSPVPGNPNNYECTGHIAAGTREAGSEEQPVKYAFLCNGLITGYQVQTQLPITEIEGSPQVTDFAGQPLADTFSCSGSFPGYAVNCVGTSTSGVGERISGQFSIGWKLCTEPRVDALLTVTYAYLEKGAITQAISGPFDLGRPAGCPATARSGKDRLSAYGGPEPGKDKPKAKRKKRGLGKAKRSAGKAKAKGGHKR
jgi:hypothetical protein